jgi:hypothetical protein
MPNFIPISNEQQLKDHHIVFEKLGKSQGFLGLGRKIYLVYDDQKAEWSIVSLNIIHRILRFVCGFYKETQKEVIRKNLEQYQFTRTQTNQDEALVERIDAIWGIRVDQTSEEDKSPTPAPNIIAPEEKSQYAAPIYDPKTHHFTEIDPQVIQLAEQLKQALDPKDLKNIQRACLFGDWKGMDYNTDSEAVKKGKEFSLLDKIATELPELGHHMFFNIRGNGECGYRAIIDGLIYKDCIQQDHVDGLKESIQRAFDNLNASWDTLPFNEGEKDLFVRSKNLALEQLDRMKGIDRARRIALLQEEQPFLAPFLTLIRCLIASQTIFFKTENLEQANSSKIDILNAPLFECSEMNVTLEQFLRSKVIADADSPRSFWAQGSDFAAIGYALNKNICCIFGNRYKDNEYGIQRTFDDQPPFFYGLNLTGQVHFNALIPLV